MAQYNPSQYYTDAEKEKLKSLSDAVAVALKNKQTAEVYYAAWFDFYNRWRNSNGLTFTDPVTNAGIWYPGTAGPTISNNVVGWKNKLDAATTAYANAQTDYEKYFDDLSKKYFPVYEKWLKSEEARSSLDIKRAEAKADSDSALASIRNTEAITNFLKDNAIFILVAVVLIIFIIVRFRRA